MSSDDNVLSIRAISEIEQNGFDGGMADNESRTHSGRDGSTPTEATGSKVVDINKYRWKKFCRGLFVLPMVA